jgi:hypothetical protein
MSQSPPPPVPVKDRSSLQRPISAVHVPQDGAPFELVQDSNSSVHNGSAFTERTPLITPPPTIWTKFNSRFKYGQYILVGAGLLGVFVIMFIVLGTLHVFKNQRYRDELGMTSVGSTKYKGDSWGTATEGHFDMGGTGDGTYYGTINDNIN